MEFKEIRSEAKTAFEPLEQRLHKTEKIQSTNTIYMPCNTKLIYNIFSF